MNHILDIFLLQAHTNLQSHILDNLNIQKTSYLFYSFQQLLYFHTQDKVHLIFQLQVQHFCILDIQDMLKILQIYLSLSPSFAHIFRMVHLTLCLQLQLQKFLFLPSQLIFSKDQKTQQLFQSNPLSLLQHHLISFPFLL